MGGGVIDNPRISPPPATPLQHVRVWFYLVYHRFQAALHISKSNYIYLLKVT